MLEETQEPGLRLVTARRVTTWSRDSSVTALTWFTNRQDGLPTAACWRERRREVLPLCTVHHSPHIETQRLRKLLFYWCFGYPYLLGQRQNKNKTKQKIIHPARLRGGSGAVTISRRAVFSISGSPVSGPLALAARFGEGLDGLAVLPMTGSTTLPGGRLILQRENGGSRRGVTSRLRGCSQSGSSRIPPAHDVFVCLILLFWCRKLLGKALDSVAKEAGLRHGSIQELYLLLLLHVSETQPECCSWTTSMDIAWPRDCAVTFVAWNARSVAACSSCRTTSSWPPSCRSLRALAWWTCSNAMACRAEAASPQSL